MHVVKRKEGRKRRGEDEKKGLLLAIFWKTTTDNRMLNMIFSWAAVVELPDIKLIMEHKVRSITTPAFFMPQRCRQEEA